MKKSEPPNDSEENFTIRSVLLVNLQIIDRSSCLWSCLSFAFDEPFVGSDLLEGHGAARAQLLRRYANLGTKAELGSVGERRGGVPVDAGGIDMLLEAAGGRFVLGDDGLAVARAVAVDVGQGLVERADGHHVHLVVHELCVVAALVVEEELHLSLHRSQQCRQVAETVFVDEQRVEGVAYADATGLGIIDDGAALLQVAVLVEIGMYHAGTRLDDRHAGRVANEVDQLPAATRYAQVYIAHRVQHLTRRLVGGRQQF